MALATLPPAFGYKYASPEQNLSTLLYWTWSPEQPPWKKTALSKISTLRKAGKLVPGLGDFTLSEEAVKAAQRLIGEIEIESLPLPTVAPVSGGAIFVSWQSGTKCVEATAYHDGEILVEALENRRVDEKRSTGDISTILRWLAQG